jgi:hypothetical protein
MARSRRYAAGLLAAGLLLASGTPIYVALAAPRLSIYLMHPVIPIGQAVPYLVCAAIWLPLRSPAAAAPRLILAALLFAVALALYLPVLWAPGKHGGDMIGLAYILIALVTTAAVVLGSATAGLVLWLRHRARRVAA